MLWILSHFLRILNKVELLRRSCQLGNTYRAPQAFSFSVWYTWTWMRQPQGGGTTLIPLGQFSKVFKGWANKFLALSFSPVQQLPGTPAVDAHRPLLLFCTPSHFGFQEGSSCRQPTGGLCNKGRYQRWFWQTLQCQAVFPGLMW